MSIVIQQPGAQQPGGGGNTPASSPSSSANSTVADLLADVQTLLEDPGGKWATYDFLKRYIGLANRDLNIDLDDYNLSYGQDVQVVSDVPANTANLDTYMADGGVLANLLQPTSIEWRNPGEDDTQWKPVKRVDKVVDAVAAESVNSWEWRASSIFVSPCINPVDLRVRFDFIALPLDDPTSAILRGSLNALAYKTSMLVAGSRGGMAGNGQPLVMWLGGLFEQAKEAFISLMVKRSQSIRRRFGRANGGGNSGPMKPPLV